MKQSELIKEQEQHIKDLKTQLEIAELRVKNLELSVDRIQYEFDSYKQEVAKQIKKHKTQKIWWTLGGIAAGILIGHSV
ncbi:MAG: hypothetical protein IJ193_07930 [Bacilli bacterium]|nr:hypothetical protein [Bacilli bacterium]